MGVYFPFHRSEDLPRPSGPSLTLLNGSSLKPSCELRNFAHGPHAEQCYWIHADFLMCADGAVLVEERVLILGYQASTANFQVAG